VADVACLDREEGTPSSGGQAIFAETHFLVSKNMNTFIRLLSGFSFPEGTMFPILTDN